MSMAFSNTPVSARVICRSRPTCASPYAPISLLAKYKKALARPGGPSPNVSEDWRPCRTSQRVPSESGCERR